jgi:hypothetical protein
VSYRRGRFVLARQERCCTYRGPADDLIVVGFPQRFLEDKYGPLGQDFIHVHHTLELSLVPPGYQVNPVTDLRPVCPNCHAMLHRTSPALTVDELSQIIHRT